MVNRKNLDKKFVLISVYKKDKLNFLCKNLKKYNYNFISTGATCEAILDLGYKCIEISKITKFKEKFDGRIKTISPKIYSSLLYLRNNKKHISQFKNMNIPKIDIVVVNLYPFRDYLNREKKDIIEMIDIGGVGLIRAASKNFEHITPISSIDDYIPLVKNLNTNNGYTDSAFRKRMAIKSFKTTTKYDNYIYKWLDNKKESRKKNFLKYGENPNQKSFIINNAKNSIFKMQLNGKKISYNNIIDLDSGYRCLSEFKEPTCVIIKHTNPCGVASSKTIESSFNKALQSDKKSAFGGIVLLNRKITSRLASKIVSEFFEVILATGFENKALNILKKKKNLILILMPKTSLNKIDYRSTIFGDVYQNNNTDLINKNNIRLVSDRKASSKSVKDLVFSLKVAKHVKSNSVVLSKNQQTLGIGVGQTNRIDTLILAINKMKQNFKSNYFVCASDGFFPFEDSIKLLKKYNCNAVVQPSGSINDKKIIAYSSHNKIPLYFTKNRLFKH